MEARMLCQPLRDVVMFMGAVIVHHQVQVQISAQIPSDKRICNIEIQLATNAEAPVKVAFELPIDETAAIAAIRKEVRSYFYPNK